MSSMLTVHLKKSLKPKFVSTLLLTTALVASTAFGGGREGHGGKAKYGDQFYFVAQRLKNQIDPKYGIGTILETGLSVRPTDEDLLADGNSVDMLSYIETTGVSLAERTQRYPDSNLQEKETRVTAMRIKSWNEMDCRAKHLLVLHELLVHANFEKSQDYHISSPLIEDLAKDGKISCDKMPSAAKVSNDGGVAKEHFVVDSMTVQTMCEKDKNLLGGPDAAFKRLVSCAGNLVVIELDTEYFRTRRTTVPVTLRLLSKGPQFLATDRSTERANARVHNFVITGHEGKKLKDVFGKYSGSMFALELVLIGGYSEDGKNASGIRINNTSLVAGGIGIAGGTREFSLHPEGTIVDIEVRTNTPGNPVQTVQETLDLESLYEMGL